MAIDNTLYDSLENTYTKIKDYFNHVQLGREHSVMIVKHEELAELLESFDIEALEEQSNNKVTGFRAPYFSIKLYHFIINT